MFRSDRPHLALVAQAAVPDDPVRAVRAGAPRLLGAALLALGLVAAGPAAAVGAKCPASTTVLEVTPQFQDGVLRCIGRARAPVACTSPTHPQHQIMPNPDVTIRLNQSANLDYCRPTNLVMASPTPAMPMSCPPGMSIQVQNGRDYCRAGATSQLAPALIPN